MTFNPSTITVASLPSVALEKRRELPRHQGIYFAVIPDGTVLYIGKAQSLFDRWQGHHRLSDLEQYSGVCLFWLQFDGSPDLLHEVERACIKHFCPLLNKPPIPKKLNSGRTDTAKRTYILPIALLERLESAAQQERRPVGRQLEIFLEKALEQYEAEQKPGQWIPELMAA